jgi:hypothetical protein
VERRQDVAGVQAATLVVGAENDSTAPVARHSIPFYESPIDESQA